MKEVLKPCPFCGGEAAIKGYIYNNGLKIWCECNRCYARTYECYPNLKHEEDSLKNIEMCKENVISNWNMRV